jgi:hypothetical protein
MDMMAYSSVKKERQAKSKRYRMKSLIGYLAKLPLSTTERRNSESKRFSPISMTRLRKTSIL